MIQSTKKNKDVTFHKVNFNNAKRFKRNNSSNKLILLKSVDFHTNNKDKDKSYRTSAVDHLIKNIEDKYSIFENNRLIKALNRQLSSKKKYNNKNLVKGKELNINRQNHQMSKIQKIGLNLPSHKKYNSFNKINQSKKFGDNKELNSLENEGDSNYNNIIREKKKKIRKKELKNKTKKFHKEEQKVINNVEQKEKYKNFVNKASNNLFCCL